MAQNMSITVLHRRALGVGHPHLHPCGSGVDGGEKASPLRPSRSLKSVRTSAALVDVDAPLPHRPPLLREAEKRCEWNTALSEMWTGSHVVAQRLLEGVRNRRVRFRSAHPEMRHRLRGEGGHYATDGCCAPPAQQVRTDGVGGAPNTVSGLRTRYPVERREALGSAEDASQHGAVHPVGARQ